MLEKYGSEEAVRAEMQRRYRNSRKNPNANKGGFHNLKKRDSAALSELSRAAANKRWEKVRGQTQSQNATES